MGSAIFFSETMKANFWKNFHALIVEKYGRKKGKYKRLAHDLDVSEQQLSPWVRGGRFMNPKRQQQVADLFGVTLEWMYEDHAAKGEKDVRQETSLEPCGLEEGSRAFSHGGPLTLNIFLTKPEGENPGSPLCSIKIGAGNE